ncbi:MAG: TlpA disulfide reductase family protein [Crocinitomicaceae bacterium]|nr:TlpA family protein disulfide reductase [Crocinitomicaceae bacterium]
MKEKKPWTFKRVYNLLTNVLLVLIICILIIPSWRTSFQGWFQRLTMSDAEFTEELKTPMPANQQNWELFTMNGEMINFAEFKGKPVVITFWATWCGACRAEMPSFGELSEQFNNDVIFLAASEESIEKIQSSKLPEKYDFLYATQTFPPFFDVSALPTLAIMDKDMNLVYRSVGAADLNTEENVAFLNQLKNQ